MKRFQSFRLDTVNQCLWHGEARVAITPKAFGVLGYLVEHPGDDAGAAIPWLAV